MVENRRCSDGRVVQRQVALFTAGSMPVDDLDAIGVQLGPLSLRRPRQWRAGCRELKGTTTESGMLDLRQRRGRLRDQA